MSKKQDKIAINKAKQSDYIIGSKRQRIEEAWEKAQIQAASAQSVLDYMVEQFNKFKDELTPEVIAQTEDQIALRQKDIKDYLMESKETYEKEIGEYNASL